MTLGSSPSTALGWNWKPLTNCRPPSVIRLRNSEPKLLGIDQGSRAHLLPFVQEMGMAVLDEAQRQRRQSVYEFLDSTKPTRARALRWCETAREMRRIDGDMKEARPLLRSALCCVKDYASVYRTWIAMEMDGGGGVGVARWLFEEWGTVCAKDGNLRKDDDGTTTDEYGDYWCAYLAFELRHGDARRARTVAAWAVKACPRDASLRDTVELRLSDAIEIEQQRRHRSGLVRSAKKWLSNVEQSRGCSSLFSRPPPAYQRLLSG